MDSIEVFQTIWDDEIKNILVKQTNMYSVEQSGVKINTNKDEIEKLLAVQMLMSIVKMPRYEIYWSKVTRYEPVASTLILKRYKKLPEFLHVVVVNVEKGKPENKEDKYFQVKTLLEAIMANCQKMEQDVNSSIDEHIILAKAKKSGGV